MKQAVRVLILCLALVQATPAPASKKPGPEAGDPKPPAESPGATPPNADAPKPTTEVKTFDVKIAVAAEGMAKLPSNSRMELQGEGDGLCRGLQRDQMIQSGGVVFHDLGGCKVKARLFITGFETKTVVLDLANYKRPIKITVKEIGPPAVEW